MGEWESVTLGSVANVVTGTTPASKFVDNWGEAMPFLTPNDMTDADYHPSVARHLSLAAVRRHESRIVPAESTAVVCIGSTIGKVALIDQPTLTNQQINTLVPKEDRAYGRFLYYLLQLQNERLKAVASGSATPIINKRSFVSIRVDIPLVDEQRRIAAVLGAFDDLIEANRNLVRHTAELARAIAASVNTKVMLSELAIRSGPKQIRPEGQVDHYSLPAFDDGQVPETVDGDSIKSNKLPLKASTVLVSRLNPKWERCWMVYPGENAVASTEFVPLEGTDAANEEIWAVTSAPHFWEQMRSRVTGTTGSHQRVSKDSVTALEVPDVRLLPLQTREQLITFVRMIQVCMDEITDLARTRDELLPLLMSGRVRVENIQVPKGAV